MEPILLVAGRDYPNTYRGFVEMFPDNAACAAYLSKLRWPKGFVCRACKANAIPWQASRGLVFRRLLERAVETGPVTETDVTNGYNWG